MWILASSQSSTDSAQLSSREENLVCRAASDWRMGSQVSASATSMILAASSAISSGAFLLSRSFSLRAYKIKQVHTFLHARKESPGSSTVVSSNECKHIWLDDYKDVILDLALTSSMTSCCSRRWRSAPIGPQSSITSSDSVNHWQNTYGQSTC